MNCHIGLSFLTLPCPFSIIKNGMLAEVAELVDLPTAGRRAGLKIMYTVYAIRSKVKNYIYVGMTADLTERIKRHNEGRERTTRPYRPFELIFKENHLTRKDARIREKYFKSGVGKDLLRKIL